MDIKIVDAIGNTPATPTETESLAAFEKAELPQSVMDSSDPDLITMTAVKQALEIESEKDTYSKEVNTLIEWAKSKLGEDAIKNPMEFKWVVRDLRMRLGTPAYGDPIKHIARFAYLELEGNRIDSEKKAMSR